MKHLIAGAFVALVLTACNSFNSGYKVTETGIRYKISKGKGSQLKGGDFIKYHVEFTMLSNGKDSVLNTSYGKVPAYGVVDTTQKRSHSYMEVLPLCGIGDKLELSMSVDTLVKLGLMQYRPPFVRGSKVNCKLEVIKKFANNNEMMVDYQKETDLFKDKEVADIENMLKKKNIKAIKTKSGVFVDMINAGEGVKADSGMFIQVLYTGRLLKNGKIFDTNRDSSFKHAEPIGFTVGLQQVIPGWDESLRLFGKGGKGKIYIPSMLAYGMQGSPPGIAPYESLEFDVDVVNVSAPKPSLTSPGEKAKSTDATLIKDK